MIVQHAQRWRDRNCEWVPRSRALDTSGLSVDALEVSKARPFVIQHHYSGTFPAARLSVGLHRGTRLIGVAVFAEGIQRAALPHWAGVPADRGARAVPARPGGAPGRRPSGIDVGKRMFAEGLETFPSALITASSPGTEPWRDRLKEEGLPAHPCPMPLAVPRTVIRMMSRPGDLVLDPFFGSGTTGAAAEELGRRWVGIDHHRLLLEGAACRPQFETASGFQRECSW